MQYTHQWNCKVKALHWKFSAQLNNENVDKSASISWLLKGTFFPETEGFLLGIQDNVIKTKNTAIAATKYLQRHNAVATIALIWADANLWNKSVEEVILLLFHSMKVNLL